MVGPGFLVNRITAAHVFVVSTGLGHPRVFAVPVLKTIAVQRRPYKLAQPNLIDVIPMNHGIVVHRRHEFHREWTPNTKEATEDRHFVVFVVIANDVEFLVGREPFVDAPNIAPRDS